MAQSSIIQPGSYSQVASTDIDQWNHVVSETFCPMECHSGAEPFNAQVGLGRLDTIRLAMIGGSELYVKRNRGHIAQVSDNFYLVKFQLNGRSQVRHRNSEAELSPGDYIICSSSDPYELLFPESYSQAVLSIPQYQLNELVHNPEQYLGQTMKGENPVNGVLTQFVFSLTQRLDQLAPQTLRRIEANVLDLLITSLESQETPEQLQADNVQQEHLNRIKQFIAMHLQDTRLSPDFIAEAEGIGTRYLHMLFKPEQVSVSRYIQLKRLEACGRTLADPNQQKVSATDIAFQWGFNDVSHFHRCFKTCYRMTPRQYRLQALKRLGKLAS